MATDSVSSATIRVRLFASYADRLGQDVIEVSASGVETAGDLLRRLRALPQGTAIGASTLVAINCRQATLDSRIVAGDEVAVMPPLAGG